MKVTESGTCSNYERSHTLETLNPKYFTYPWLQVVGNEMCDDLTEKNCKTELQR